MSYVASPSVRSYAAQKGVDLARLARESGRETLAREDVDQAAAGMTPAPASVQDSASGVRTSHYWEVDHAAHGPVREEELPRFATLAAANLSAANAAIPQVTHHDCADMRAIESFRARLKPEAQVRGTKLTALAFHVAVLARCLRQFPRFNSSLSADGRQLILKEYVHIGIAVDTPHGLMVPVIRDAGDKGLWALAAEIADLAARAQTRKIRPEEMGGASMSISNLGGIGGNGFTPIVNPPEVAILGLTRTRTQPVHEDGSWVPVPMCPLDLSYDHRVVNGADAARFLSRYAALLGEPRRLLLC
ncbi:2-oxo acid dehydrogenase subunit E2 [Acidimangrovimonas sediminis]|uniref:2-oxo acid dehydrogenase subunit E2 n=1 Tax=Acidimangrovimonas sediminis TaxID=2056283 RepID=UPI000C7FBE73|nr:2-oxo acid dehydrogenase subunit E2 [Acidimangrovimonas sediminis]